MLHAKLKGMEHSSYSVLTHTHPQPVSRVIKGKKKSECGHVAYQIKGKEVKTDIEAKYVSLPTPLTSRSG